LNFLLLRRYGIYQKKGGKGKRAFPVPSFSGIPMRGFKAVFGTGGDRTHNAPVQARRRISEARHRAVKGQHKKVFSFHHLPF
jgi:hypothetical protein